MRVVGVDPSSAVCGFALVDNDVPVKLAAWKRPPIGSAPARLDGYFSWLEGWLQIHTPDLACIEFLSVERNAQTTRVVAMYQGISALACKRSGCIVVEARATSARKIVLGDGSLAKREVFDQIKKRYPELSFDRFDKTGGDQADALILALAAKDIAES